jgi:nucleoside-diphosphate-sugar epimerase
MNLELTAMPHLERVVVLGASGWVGRTACNWLNEMGTQILLFAGSNRSEAIGKSRFRFHTFDQKKIKDFKPTAVIDAAFITREKVGAFPLASYIQMNTELTEQGLELQRLSSVEKFIGISSGASVQHLTPGHPELKMDPYGSLKATYEKRLIENPELRAKTTIGRIWSVSGNLVTKPSLFAFSSLIQQALGGHVDIHAMHRVWRRYVDLEDFLKVVSLSSPGDSRVIDSGGRLMEIQQLAELIFSELKIAPSISRNLDPGSSDDLYYSNGSTWVDAIKKIEFVPLTVEQQISKVLSALRVEP